MGLSWMLKQCDFVLVLVLVMAPTGESLTGENLCQRLENYTATWQVSYKEPVAVQTSSWCLSVPPRCWKSQIVMKTRYKMKGETRQRNVTECCDGYTPQKLSIDDGNNTVTKCVAVSQCKPGFIGKSCNIECPSGSWGILCKEACNCVNHICNPVTGACQCTTGWSGKNCSDKCKSGKWGIECASDCSCSDQNKSCHHVTGNCPELIESEDKQSKPNNWTAIKLFESSMTVIPVPSTESIQTDLPGSTKSTKNQYDVEIKDFPDSTRPQKIYENKLNSATDRNEIAHNSTLITTPLNEYHEQTSPNIHVIQVDKSTTKPILALVHMSGPTVIGHDKMIIQPMNAERVPGHTMPLPLELAVIVVVGSILSLSLTALAVLALLHVRSKLFETIRLSIYDAEKQTATLQRQKGNDERMHSLARNSRILSQSSDYETPRCIVPNRTLTLPRSISTISTFTRESTYSNQFPNIRLFSSPQELMEAHYDRPPPTNTFRQLSVPGGNEGEHLYDEIPLQTTLLKKYNDVLQ